MESEATKVLMPASWLKHIKMKKLTFLIALGLVTLGACKKTDRSHPCVNQNQKDLNALCTADYIPVCGCDGETYSNACVATNYGGVTSYTPGVCGCTYRSSGTVVDYTGLDGCGVVIEMAGGKILEPVHLPAHYSLTVGDYVEFDYRVITTHASACMAGELADIVCIRSKGCEPIKITFNPGDTLFRDEVVINEANISGNCININLSYGGGCGEHDFELRLLPMCATPPMPPIIQLVHNGNGDLCQAYLTKNMSFDISALKEPGKQSVDFSLMDFGGKYHKNFTYNY